MVLVYSQIYHSFTALNHPQLISEHFHYLQMKHKPFIYPCPIRTYTLYLLLPGFLPTKIPTLALSPH